MLKVSNVCIQNQNKKTRLCISCIDKQRHKDKTNIIVYRQNNTLKTNEVNKRGGHKYSRQTNKIAMGTEAMGVLMVWKRSPSLTHMASLVLT